MNAVGGFYNGVVVDMADDCSIKSVFQSLLAEKFANPLLTVDNKQRAFVDFDRLDVLWINTGTQCNIECANCYIHSSPTNDRLGFINNEQAGPLILEAARMGAKEVGFTGGEPFLNPHVFDLIKSSLAADLSVLILTNAMRPMMRPKIQTTVSDLISTFGDQIKFRVSLDHFTKEGHDKERGNGSFASALSGLEWLKTQGATISIAGRMGFSDSAQSSKEGYQALFDRVGLGLVASDSSDLILFPEMEDRADPPEITTDCWDILNVDPHDMMCASSRMVVLRKGAKTPDVIACTLLPDDEEFDLGKTLHDAATSVRLNHRHCATFCVLGGASCSGGQE